MSPNHPTGNAKQCSLLEPCAVKVARTVLRGAGLATVSAYPTNASGSPSGTGRWNRCLITPPTATLNSSYVWCKFAESIVCTSYSSCIRS